VNEEVYLIDLHWKKVEKEISLSRDFACFEDSNRKTDEEQRAMHLKYLEMKEKYDDIAEKMRFFERVC
jgi:hypothetical protein